MQRVLARIEREVPGAHRSTDSPGRETEIAIDHSEFATLPQDRTDQVLALMQAEGMHATVSSIHINGWYGDHSKLSGARWIAQQLYGQALDPQAGDWVYVGDSTNDQLMFQCFRASVGVANVRRFETQLGHLPRYISCGARGAGFAEVARAVLAARPAA